jgi:hypothetical protein
MDKLTWAICIILVFVAFPVLAVITLGFVFALMLGGSIK